MKQQFDHWRAHVCQAIAAIFGAAALGGCAGGAWLESPADADLALDLVAQPYPTAVDPNAPQQAPVKQPAEYKPRGAPATPLGAAPARVRQLQQPPQPIAIQTQRPSEPIPIALPPTSENAPSNPAPQPVARQTSPPSAVPSVGVPPPAGPNVDAPPPIPGVGVIPASASGALPTGNAVAAELAREDRQATIERARGELTAAFEAEIRDRRSQNPTDEELPRMEQQLRLLYLTANRIDDAMASVESLDEPQREAFKHAMFGLGVWMSPDEARRAPLRSAKVLRSLRDASTELAAASKLELRNLVFCERVEQFGWFTEFSRNEFRPKQQVILYVEIENFAAEKKGPSYETELQGSYQIFDAGGRIVAERQLPLDRETCHSYRRDYFLAYPMYLPETIEPGRYRLELTVEDMKAKGDYQGRKFGAGMIEFTIRQ